MKFFKPLFFLITSCFSNKQNSSYIVEYSKDRFVNVGTIVNIKNNSVEILSQNLPFKVSSEYTLVGKKNINHKECTVLSVKIGPFIRKNVNICNKFLENKSIVLDDKGEKIMVLRKIDDFKNIELNEDDDNYNNVNNYDFIT
jgi:hypothetical protein